MWKLSIKYESITDWSSGEYENSVDIQSELPNLNVSDLQIINIFEKNVTSALLLVTIGKTIYFDPIDCSYWLIDPIDPINWN